MKRRPPRDRGDDRRDSPRADRSDAPSDARRGTRRDPPRDAPRDTRRDAPRDALRDAPRDTPRDDRRDAPYEAPRHRRREVPRDQPRAAPRDAPERARHKGAASDSERLVVGRHPVIAVLEHQRVRAQRLHYAPEAADVAEIAKQAGVGTQPATDDQLASRAPSGVPHQGLVLECGAFPYADIEDLDTAPDVTLVLDGVVDPRNFGAAARAAFALGASLLVVPADRSAPCSASAYKASSGALARIPVARPQNLKRALELLKEKGAWLVGAEADGPEKPWDVDMNGSIVLVIGGEDRGLRRLTREACDHVVSIPMASSGTSLNAADAATVLLYEALRQRKSAASPS